MNTLNIINQYQQLFSHRDLRLFTEFLPVGYDFLTLSSVPSNIRQATIVAKTHLGILITLYDDLADNPHLANSLLLNELYKIPFATSTISRGDLKKKEKEVINFAIYLTDSLIKYLSLYNNFFHLQEILYFDLLQFYNCNRYFELILKNKNMINLFEIQHFSSFNMGIVMAGMIDLIVSDYIETELGLIREFFYYAQRFGKISNNLTTLKRELREEDFSNELLLVKNQQLVDHEKKFILKKLDLLKENIYSFDGQSYIAGLVQLDKLHHAYEGVI